MVDSFESRCIECGAILDETERDICESCLVSMNYRLDSCCKPEELDLHTPGDPWAYDIEELKKEYVDQ